MFELTGVSLHNWYLVDALDIPIQGHTAIIGQTGAGKSSVLDAIQTIISGNNKNVIELNAAAGETRGRTVKEYISGVVSDFNDGQPQRKNCESTIALKFFDREKGKNISIGLFFTISDYERVEKTKRFIIEDYDFQISNFIRDKKVFSHKEMKDKIEHTHKMQVFDNSSKYVQRYLEITRPILTPDSKHFLRSFSNTLQAREISNPTLFVTRFLLEPSNIDIRSAKESIKIWRDLNIEVEETESKVNELNAIHNFYFSGFQRELNSLIQKKQQRMDALNKIEIEKDVLLKNLRNSSILIQEIKSKKETLSKEMEEIINYEKTKEKRESIKRTLNHFLKDEIDLIEEGEDFSINFKDKSQILNREMLEIREKILNLDDKIGGDLFKIKKEHKEDVRLSDYCNKFITELKKHNIKYDLALNHIFITNGDWKNAIENMLNLNKEALIIPNINEQKIATDILINHKNTLFNCRIIKPNLVKNKIDIKNSILRYCEFTNETVETFVTNLIGHYQTVSSFEELKKYDFSVTMNSLSSNKNFIRVLRNSSAQLQMKLSDESLSKKDREEASNRINQNELLRKQFITRLNHLENEKRKLDNIINNIDMINDNISMLQQISISEFSLEQTNEIKFHLEKITEEENKVKVDILIIEKDIEVIERKRAEFNNQNLSDEDEQINKLNEILLIKNDAKFIENLKRTSQINDIQNANNKLLEFCQKWMETGLFAENKSDFDRFKWVTSTLEYLKNNQLIKYKDKLKEAYREMTSIIKSGLILKLGDNFDYLERQLISVNEKLHQHSFVGQKYTFKKSVKPEMKKIVELISQISCNKERLILESIEDFDEIINPLLDEDSKIDQFEDYRNYFTYEMYVEYEDKENKKVLSSPFSEIMGKLSGGQRQAPYYVAIAASMVNTYYPKSKGEDLGEGMGLLVFDEAFNKLDIPNTQKLMNLFKDLNLQVIVAAPEEKRSSLIESVDSIINVNRIPSTGNIFIDPISIGEKTKEEMKKQNPIYS